jgi:predicted transcriptional regulator
MTRKRSRFEIYIDVLRTIRGGEKVPTRVMYRTNLSWVPLKKILESLNSQNLIEKRESSRRKQYIITEKGRKVLKYFDETLKLIKVE